MNSEGEVQLYEMEMHPQAVKFPAMTDAEFEALVEDIGKNGQRVAIKIKDGKIVDGGNRYRGCKQLGIEPKFEEIDVPDEEIQAFSISLNKHRRHLTSSQLAAFAADAVPALAATATKRKGGRPKKNEKPPQKIGEVPETGEAMKLAAKAYDTNAEYVRQAGKIKQADPLIHEHLKDGHITLPEAKEVIDLPEAQRQEFHDRLSQGEAAAEVLASFPETTAASQKIDNGLLVIWAESGTSEAKLLEHIREAQDCFVLVAVHARSVGTISARLTKLGAKSQTLFTAVNLFPPSDGKEFRDNSSNFLLAKFGSAKPKCLIPTAFQQEERTEGDNVEGLLAFLEKHFLAPYRVMGRSFGKPSWTTVPSADSQ